MSSQASHFFTAALTVALAMAGCSRTPPEPAPPTPMAPNAQAESPGKVRPSDAPARMPARCIVPLAEVPPAIPAAAPVSRCPRDPEPDLVMPVTAVSFPDAPGAPSIDIELARSPHDIERGLMYRRTMPDNRGMLFRLDARREQVFWMHNTCIPLDMMFIDEDGVIVGIVESATPLTDTPRSVQCPSRFVLEVNAGWVRRRGVAPGQTVSLPFSAR
jgi:uncharacterized membrane protein (UPF0127 family)